jgi:cysteine desulfurase
VSAPTNDVIYLDHAATTPLDPDVLRAMMPYLAGEFGNPSSVYGLGQATHGAVDSARETISAILTATVNEIVFTGGATESANLALSGVAWAARQRNPSDPWPHIVTTAIEHSAVLETARWLERIGFGLTTVPCDREGIVAPAAIVAAIRPETCLVSVMLANNEVGSIQDIPAIAAICQERGVPLHCDATQGAGSLGIGVEDLGVDLLTLSAHKFYGPKGVGLLYVRNGTDIEWQQRGGGQEGGRRGGTENVAGIVGMAVALDRAERFRPAYAAHCTALRDRLLAGLRERLPEIVLNGPAPGPQRLPNNLNVVLPGVQGETVLLALDMEGVAASAGSACTVGRNEPSHVLEAMGLSDADTRTSIRLTVGRGNTVAQIDDAVDAITGVVERTRPLAGAR